MEISIQTAELDIRKDELKYDDMYRRISSAGFHAVDWNLDCSWKSAEVKKGNFEHGCIFDQPLEQVCEAYAPELDAMHKYGVRPTQAHAPFPAWHPDCPDLLEYAIRIYQRCIEYCDYAGCPRLVIHGISYMTADTQNTKADIELLNRHLYESLIPVLRRTKVTVCMENLFSGRPFGSYLAGVCSDPYEAADMIDTMNAEAGKECFGFCLDTGHLNLLRGDFRTFLPVIGDRLKCLHVHDNNQTGDQHRAPYTGTVDWENFYDALKKIGYRGDVSFETYAQYRQGYLLDEKMLDPWLHYLAEIGAEMIRRIGG